MDTLKQHYSHQNPAAIYKKSKNKRDLKHETKNLRLNRYIYGKRGEKRQTESTLIQCMSIEDTPTQYSYASETKHGNRLRIK